MATSSGDARMLKRKCCLGAEGVDSFDGKRVKASSEERLKKQANVDRYAQEYSDSFARGHVANDKPFVGAQPKLLRQPEIADAAETARKTAVVIKTVIKLIATSTTGVHIILAQDAGSSPIAKDLLDVSTDERMSTGDASILSLNLDWMHTLPLVEPPKRPATDGRLVIYVGTPGKFLSMCIRSAPGRFDDAYKGNRLVVLCRGVCMLPLGTQEQNVYGVDNDAVFGAISRAVRARGAVFWGHGLGTKAGLMQRAFGYPSPEPMPAPLAFADDVGGAENGFDHLVSYVEYLNRVKMAKPSLPVTNWYDTGLLVSVLQGAIAERGVSMLTDRDGLAMLRDAGIGHIMSKLNQVIAVEAYSTMRGVYNFFIGDGACRLNGGAELVLHLMEGYKARSLTTLFVFNNHKWAIEDNLVADAARQHVLYDADFYNLLGSHSRVAVCEGERELREVVSFLSKKTELYLRGHAEPGLSLIVVRGLDVTLPPVLGNIDPVLSSPEMAFMRSMLGKFAEGCDHRVPLYGCSAFEYIQYLHLFLEKMPEGKKYQYVCGRTDIQAAHMCGFKQPDGRCVLFVNDIFGINSLGESLRMVLSGFGGKQLLVMIWHPSLMQLMDHFHLHRPPLVWPSLGPTLAKHYVRKEDDALFVDFEGESSADSVSEQVTTAIGAGTPLICINVLPEQERDFVSLDIRAKTD